MFLLNQSGAKAADEKLYVEDVFSAFTYKGTGAVQSIVNGIDLAGEGGMFWGKCRTNSGYYHQIYDTLRGPTKSLCTNLTNGSLTMTGLNSFNSDGITLLNTSNGGFDVNVSGQDFAGWFFQQADKFFKMVEWTGNGATSRVLPHGLKTTPGNIVVKRTLSSQDWYVWHRGLTAGRYLVLNTTAAEATSSAIQIFGDGTITVNPTDSVFTVGEVLNANGITYIAYIWAHDDSDDGIIQCGTFTPDGSGNVAVSLGWEPQFILFKNSTSTGDWKMLDTARGWNLGNDQELIANGSSAEVAGARGEPTASGFKIAGSAAGTFVYMAIRKGLMRPPTDASKVFAINARTGTGAAATVTAGSITTGVDFAFARGRASGYSGVIQDRLRGAPGPGSFTNSASAEFSAASGATEITSFNMNGVTVGSGTNAGTINSSGTNYINYFLKQARGFFDIVAYAGTGAAHTEKHNLGVVPELIIVKRRNGTQSWGVFAQPMGAGKYLGLNLTNAQISDAAIWNNTLPTDEVFSVGSSAVVSNNNGDNHVAYLFASCPGVSKIGVYTGSDAAQNIDCGFAAGARFVLIKRTDSTGDWYFWDSTRGIISGNDPYLLMNDTAAEVTTVDYIDPYSPGFTLDATAPAALNASGGTYLYLAIA